MSKDIVYLLEKQSHFMDPDGTDRLESYVWWTTSSLEEARAAAWSCRHDLLDRDFLDHDVLTSALAPLVKPEAWFRIRGFYLGSCQLVVSATGEFINELYGPDGVRCSSDQFTFNHNDVVAFNTEYFLTISWEDQKYSRAITLLTKLINSSPLSALTWLEHLPPVDRAHFPKNLYAPLVGHSDKDIRLRALALLPTHKSSAPAT